MRKSVARWLLASLLVAAGGGLIYAAGWMAFEKIAPQAIASAGGLTDVAPSRGWRSSPIYLLVILNSAVGAGLLVRGARLFRHDDSSRPEVP